MMDRVIQRLNQRGLIARLLPLLQRLGLLTPAFRFYERLSAWNVPATQDRWVQTEDPGRPLPPPDLRVLVAGTASSEWFVSFGQAMFHAIQDLLWKHGAAVADMHAILEFGCGCGRVLRYWEAVRGPVIYGTDYNARLIAWCQENLPFAKTGINQLQPPLSYADRSFDLIYVISVFTHLAEALQTAWFQELTRVLKPGGYLLITTHGESYLPKMSQLEAAAFEAGELVVRYEETSGTNLCSAYHPQVYVRNQLARGYTICEFVPAGRQEAIYQDMYLLQKS